MIAGARSFVAISEWVAHQPVEALGALGLTTHAGPDESTIRRIFGLIDADVLDKVLGALHADPHPHPHRRTASGAPWRTAPTSVPATRPKVMATRRSTAISLLRLRGIENTARGLRHYARDPETVLKLLLTR